jgi:serine/threonine protein kinase
MRRHKGQKSPHKGLQKSPHKGPNKALIGGEVLGHAGQGCIIYPTWSSNIPDYLKGKYVTKIMSKDNSDSEFKVSNFLKTYDPDGQFGIYNEGRRNCQETTLEKLKQEGIQADASSDYTNNKCLKIAQNILLRKNKKYCTITIPKFDSDASVKLPISQEAILEALKNLWRGLAFYHSLNVVHNDIKKGNIAFSDGTLKYFDWGWSCILKDKKSTEYQYEILVDANMSVTAQNLVLSQPYGWHMQRNALKFTDVFALAQTTLKILKLNEITLGRHTNLKQFISIILEEAQSDIQEHDTTENYANMIISYL